MDDSKKTIIAVLGSILAGGFTYILVKNKGGDKVSAVAGNGYVTINGRQYSVTGNINKQYGNKSFLQLLKDRNWKNTLCSDTAKHCIVMNDKQMSVARFLHAIIGDVANHVHATPFITSGIRDQQIIDALLSTGHRVSPTTDHTYGLYPNPAGQGAIDVSFGRKTKSAFKYLVYKAKNNETGFNKLYQIIYYPHEQFIHIGYKGDRSLPISSLRYMWFSDNAINGKHYHAALGVYA